MMNSLKLRQFEVRKSETHFLSERKYFLSMEDCFLAPEEVLPLP
jgi:hypothetical protein